MCCYEVNIIMVDDTSTYIMEAMRSCGCCLLRAPVRNMSTPYYHLGKTEIYSAMLTECLDIHLDLNIKERGICDMCVGRLRDARDFKLQVERCQAELQMLLRSQSMMEIKSNGCDIDTVEETPETKSNLLDLPGDQIHAINLSKDNLIEPIINNTVMMDATVTNTHDSSVSEHDVKKETATESLQVSEHDVKKEPATESNHLQEHKPGNTANMDATVTYTIDSSVSEHDVKKETAVESNCLQEHETTVKTETAVKETDDVLSDDEVIIVLTDLVDKQVKTEHCYDMTAIAEKLEEDGILVDEDVTRVKVGDVWVASLSAGAHAQLLQRCSVPLTRLEPPLPSLPAPPSVCPHCARTLPHPRALRRHLLTHAVGTYACDTCGKELTNKLLLIRHIKRHMMQKLYYCNVCSIGFFGKRLLKQHEVIHVARRYVCEICDKRFSEKHNLQAHKRIHAEPAFCEVCDERFPDVPSLKKHKLSHSSAKLVACQVCGKQYSRLHALRKHQLIHHNVSFDFGCRQCSIRFARMADLILHRQKSHATELNACVVCDKRFVRKYDLDLHVATHTGQQHVACEVCSKRFLHRKHLARHQRTHSGEKPYTCDLCLKQFAQRACIIQHIKKHMGLKTHKCGVCNEMFIDGRALSRHKRKKHKTTHCCEICETNFSKKSYLVRHLQIHMNRET